ncbi:uncharacterized protein At1g10890-like [Cryptomeria japonica]|uniref:uncharacterized protein At1g10890-like n=1 Tax=Cryptomeria japonica TaxID=3369 RepID=UPI0027DA9D67|nr:uncharacterized protein At1g10890-like [Cryptomeria japonica]
MVKPKKTKPKNPSSKPMQTRNSTPSFSAQKLLPPSKPQSKPSGGAEKMKKGKPERVYVVATMEEETESNEAVREVKKSEIVSRVVKMQSSGEGRPSKKLRVEVEQFDITLNQVKEAIIEQDDNDNNKKIADSGEAAQDLLVMTADLEKNTQEVDIEKGEDAEKVEKEKDEGKVEHVLVARDTMKSDKGNYVE